MTLLGFGNFKWVGALLSRAKMPSTSPDRFCHLLQNSHSIVLATIGNEQVIMEETRDRIYPHIVFRKLGRNSSHKADSVQR